MTVGAAPLWLVALVIARDVADRGGRVAGRSSAVCRCGSQPLLIGKATTAVQVGYVGVLAVCCWPSTWMRRDLMAAAGYTVAVFALLSRLAYAQRFPARAPVRAARREPA